MNPLRRLALLRMAQMTPLAGLGWPAGAAETGAVQRGRAWLFPRDHGTHLGARTEWWYATGWLGQGGVPTHGFQVTFFRSRTGLAEGLPSRFAARHLLFAHAAVTALAARRHDHDQRIARWSGAAGAVLGSAAEQDGAVRLAAWSLRRDGERWLVQVPARDFKLELALARTQPLLLQGDGGYSLKGPDALHASHYYSEPQLAVSGRVFAAGQELRASGQAWLDHEWSDQILHPDAVGWDWIGINLFDGSALTAFRLRQRDGSALWAGGSHRMAGGVVQNFSAAQVRMVAGRRWRSPGSAASYPVQWQIETPAGRFELRALFDAQELDSRHSTGTIYWEGLSELLDTAGARVGLGYLEMTGYAAPLRLN